jgi:hypothetical protein
MITGTKAKCDSSKTVAITTIAEMRSKAIQKLFKISSF